jgi:hypothetical protein
LSDADGSFYLTKVTTNPSLFDGFGSFQMARGGRNSSRRGRVRLRHHLQQRMISREPSQQELEMSEGMVRTITACRRCSVASNEEDNSLTKENIVIAGDGTEGS